MRRSQWCKFLANATLTIVSDCLTNHIRILLNKVHCRCCREFLHAVNLLHLLGQPDEIFDTPVIAHCPEDLSAVEFCVEKLFDSSFLKFPS